MEPRVAEFTYAERLKITTGSRVYEYFIAYRCEGFTVEFVPLREAFTFVERPRRVRNEDGRAVAFYVYSYVEQFSMAIYDTKQ